MPTFIFMHTFREEAGVTTCTQCGQTPEQAYADVILISARSLFLGVCRGWMARFTSWSAARQAIREVSAERPADFQQGIDPGNTRPAGW